MAVSVSLPAASDPAGTLIVALPLTSAVAAEVYVPLVNVTVPVAVGAPFPPLTLTVTDNVWTVVTLVGVGVTVTVGATVVTVTGEEVPLAVK